MDKNALTLSEALKLEKELTKQGITVVEPVTEVPEGLYNGNFQTQDRDGNKDAVIRVIEYNNSNGKPMVIFTAKADITNDQTAKSYNGVGIALNEQMKEYLSNPVNLAKEHIFRAKQGRVRTFVQLADE